MKSVLHKYIAINITKLINIPTNIFTNNINSVHNVNYTCEFQGNKPLSSINGYFYITDDDGTTKKSIHK